MDRIAKIISGEMWDLIQTCYLGPKLRQELPGLASRGDCAGILQRCQNLPPNVGQGIKSSGKKPIEDVLPELVRLHRIYEAIKRACSGGP